MTSSELQTSDDQPTRFVDFGLSKPLLQAISEEGYTRPTPIQTQTIPTILLGRDLLGCAQTGSGKTAAFALPILETLSHRPPPKNQVRKVRCLVLAPTRELAAQIGESFRVYGKHCPLKHALVFGGVTPERQIKALRPGVDILVATPGRLRDLLHQEHVDLNSVEVLILDEADRMLDMGFLPEVEELIQELPTERQTLLFSATLPREICQLAERFLRDPVEVHVAPERKTVETIEQSVYFVERRNKPVLLRHYLRSRNVTRGLIFVNLKHQADRIALQLKRADFKADALHSDKTQLMREKALADFRAQRIQLLVATDIAARGIDVEDISHVINFDVPRDAETYIHRIGRTARIGKKGVTVTFCDPAEKETLDAIQKFIRLELLVELDQPVYAAPVPATAADESDAAEQVAGEGAEGGTGGDSEGSRLNRRQRKVRAEKNRREGRRSGESDNSARKPQTPQYRSEQQGRKRLGRKGRK